MSSDIAWANIALLALDCDGVLTDGGVYVGGNNMEMRRFHIHDGLGIRHIMKAGVQVAIISAANAPSIAHRGAQLKVTETHINVGDKTECLMDIAARLNIPLTDCAFMGDDLVDLEPMSHVGFPLSVANGRLEVREKAVYVTNTSGGFGAVREITDLVTQAKSNSAGHLL